MDHEYTIAEHIKKLRGSLKLSQAAFAAEIGVVRSTVAKWEASDSMPAANHIAAICRRFRIGPSTVLGLAAEKLPESAHDRLTRVLKAQGTKLASQVLGVPEGVWPAVEEGRFLVSPESMRELATCYKVSLAWLHDGAPASWTPSLDTGISERLRYLRICLGKEMPNEDWEALEKSESFARKHVQEAIRELDTEKVLTAMDSEANNRFGSLFPFSFDWVITGKV
jgi:transcriptional regulator with XRE-family HTH domain